MIVDLIAKYTNHINDSRAFFRTSISGLPRVDI
jgi:hypothetical protein